MNNNSILKNTIITVFLMLGVLLGSSAYAQANQQDIATKLVPILYLLQDDEVRIEPPIVEPATFTAHRTIGVAPLAVYFDSESAGKVFHDHYYQWNFGDAASGTWSTNGKPKNTDTGPMAAHVYEQAGTYTVTLTITDAGGVVSQQQQMITVTDPDEAYFGSNTICVSSGSDFSGCPPGAQHNTVSAADAYPALYNLMESNKRVLLKRGDTWNISSRPILSASNLQVGAFGACSNPNERVICDNAPTIINNNTSRAVFRFSSSASNIIVQHINATALSSANGGTVAIDQASNVLIHKVKGTVSGSIFGSDVNYFFVSDSDVSGGGHAAYIFGRHIVFMGSDIYNNTAQFGHVMRLPYANRSILIHNRLSGTFANSQHIIKLHGIRDATRQKIIAEGRTVYDTDYVYLANNLFGRGSAWAVSIAPQNDSSNEPLTNIIFEKNRFDYTYGSVVPSSQGIQLNLQAQNVTVRNNIFDTSGAPSNVGPRIVDIKDLGPSPAATNIKIYNNTINASQQDYDFNFIGIRVCSTCQADVKNNLIVPPAGNDPQDIGVQNNSSVSIFENNLYITNPDFVDDENITPRLRDYRINAASPANNAGQPVLVRDYYDGMPRIGDYDVGAGKSVP